METITGALATAATSGLTKIGTSAIVDTYNGIKTLIQNKYGKTDLPDAVEKLEQKPDSQSRQGMVQEELKTAGADKDQEMLDLVNQLIEALKETPEGQKAIGKYNLNIHNSKVGNIGDNAKIKGGINL